MTRLRHLVSWCDGYKVLLDVGTDHAKLPLLAVQETSIEKAYASDNKPGPLKRAQVNIVTAGQSAVITALHGDGLDVLTDDVDVIVIAGLGGSLIQSMLVNKDLSQVQRIIVQPTNKPARIRALTRLIPWQIEHETLLFEKNIPYLTFVFAPGCEPYSEKEMWYGRQLIAEKNQDYYALLQSDYAFLTSLLEQIPDGKKPQDLVAKKTYLEEIFHDWS